MRKTSGVLLFVAIAILSMAAQTINVADLSDKDSQISLTGTVTFGKGTSCSLQGENQSSKSVQDVALIVKITRPDGIYAEFNVIHTHQNGIDTGQVFSALEGDCSPNTDFANHVRKTADSESATAETLAVRYMDGTIWGNQKLFR